MCHAAAALLAGSLLAAPVHVTLTAPTHTPKINTRWYYVVRATQNGQAAAGKLTVRTWARRRPAYTVSQTR